MSIWNLSDEKATAARVCEAGVAQITVGRGRIQRLGTLGRVAATAALFALAAAQKGYCQTSATQLLAELPEDPGASLQANGSQPDQSSSVATGSISGIALDVNGGVVPGAAVTLTTQTGQTAAKTVSADDGSFTFSGLGPDVYRVAVEAQGLRPYISAGIALTGAQSLEVPTISLLLSGADTAIEVTATQEQVAAEQVHEQEQQRVLGVFPNFYTSYIWTAAPMSSKQKFGLALRATIDPITFLAVAGVAGAEQARSTFPAYESGIEGFGKRYSARYADVFASRMIGSAVLPSLFHQDPRYFYMGAGSTRSRLLYAMSSVVITRGDNGRRQVNYSHLLGNLAAGGLANLYRPAKDRGVALTFETALVEAGVDALGNVVREFLLRAHVPSVPKYANGKN